MSQKKRGLGRGLSDLGLNELLGDLAVPAATTEQKPLSQLPMTPDSESTNNHMTYLDIDLLSPGQYQPRKNMSEAGLQELADSIHKQGILQPIIARPIEPERYEIIAGERRWRAAQIVGLTKVPVIIRTIPDETAIAIALIENIQRRDLNAIEEATALERLVTEFKLTHQEVAQSVGKSRTVVTNLLRLLRLHPNVKVLVEQGHLEMGHGRALLAIDGTIQCDLANQVIAQALTVRATERLVQQYLHRDQQQKNNQPLQEDPTIHLLQERLTQRFSAAVTIRQNSKGKGRLIIHYRNQKELDAILETL